jgi:glycosyltransferase involved in cell wall biosynthesis
VRIVYLHQYFNTPLMSGSTRSFEVGRRLAAAGHAVEIVTALREPAVRRGWFTTEEAGMRVHWLPVPYSNHMGYPARLGAFLRFALGAANRAAALNADIVFASSTPLTIALPAIYAARRMRVPMVLEVRDLWPELPIALGALRDPVSRVAARWLERRAYNGAARVIALSPGMADGIARAGYPRERITVVPNAADLEDFRRDPAVRLAFRRRLGIGDEVILVAYVGTIGKVNGLKYLVDVAHALRDDPRLTFLIVGDGRERHEVESLARERGLLDRNLRMLAQMPKRDVAAVLFATDIALSLCLPIPELEANSANKFFDALAAGCCTAVNYGGWQAKLLESCGAGVRLPADPGGGAALLRELAGDRERIARAGRNARRLAEERFSRDLLASRVADVLADAVSDLPAASRKAGP